MTRDVCCMLFLPLYFYHHLRTMFYNIKVSWKYCTAYGWMDGGDRWMNGSVGERMDGWLGQIITPILPTVKMLSLGGERLHPPPLKKKKKKCFSIITCTNIWLCYHYYGVFFAHLLILEYPYHHQNLISSRTPP